MPLRHCIHVFEVVHVDRWTELMMCGVFRAYAMVVLSEIVRFVDVDVLTELLHIEYVVRTTTLIVAQLTHC
jgi:hypothetical protein